MNHDEARAYIRQQFVDGQLAPDVTRALRTHLLGCSSCRELYDRWADAEGALGASRAAAAAADRMWPLVEPELAPKSWVARRRIAAVVGIAAAAAAAAIVFLPSTPEGPVVDFRLQFRGAMSSHRSSSLGAPEVVYSDADLVLELIAEDATDEALEVRAFWVDDTRARPLDGEWDRRGNGSLLWRRGRTGNIPPPGRYRLVVIVGRDLEASAVTVQRTAARHDSPAVERHEFEAARSETHARWFVVDVEVRAPSDGRE